jgi:DNA-binding NarL/FixJ family response regulator
MPSGAVRVGRNVRALVKIARGDRSRSPAAGARKAPRPFVRRSYAETMRRATFEPSPERLRIVIADGDPLARRVIRDCLDADRGFVVAAEAKDGVEAVELAVHYRPEVVLMEVGLPGLGGIEACRQIIARAPDVRVVMFSVPQERDIELRALRAGASGFLSKNLEIASLGRALRCVARGEAAVSRSLTSHLVQALRATSENGAGMRPIRSPLTTREWEVLDLICSGFTTHEIARDLYLTEDTVYSHTKSILRKLGVHSRAEAAIAAARLRQPGFV